MLHEEENVFYWNKMREGDKQAFFELYNNNYFHLVRFGLRIIADDELVKDCITQLFFKLWDKHDKLNDVTNIQAYLSTALRRHIIDQLNYQSKLKNAIDNSFDKNAVSELSYEEIIIQIQHDEELKQKLHLALKQLTNRQIELIQLKFFEGLSYEQIAVQTNQTIKTAYNTIYDAIKQLKKRLK